MLRCCAWLVHLGQVHPMRQVHPLWRVDIETVQGDVVEQSRADEEWHEACRAQQPVARMEREGYGGE